MISFGYNQNVVKAESIETGLAICNELSRLENNQQKIQYLRSIKYGHNF